MSFILIDDPIFGELIDADAEPIKLGDDYEAAEGPVWNRREQALYFSDIAGDVRWRWTAEGGMEVAAQPCFKGNGMAYDIDGGLLCCEQATSCLVRLYDDGRRDLVAFHYGGVWNAMRMMEKGLLQGPVWVTFFLGWKGGCWTPPTPKAMVYMADHCPDDFIWNTSVMDPVPWRLTAVQRPPTRITTCSRSCTGRFSAPTISITAPACVTPDR